MSEDANNKKAYNGVNMYCILKRYLYTMTRIIINNNYNYYKINIFTLRLPFTSMQHKNAPQMKNNLNKNPMFTSHAFKFKV